MKSCLSGQTNQWSAGAGRRSYILEYIRNLRKSIVFRGFWLITCFFFWINTGFQLIWTLDSNSSWGTCSYQSRMIFRWLIVQHLWRCKPLQHSSVLSSKLVMLFTCGLIYYGARVTDYHSLDVDVSSYGSQQKTVCGTMNATSHFAQIYFCLLAGRLLKETYHRKLHPLNR